MTQAKTDAASAALQRAALARAHELTRALSHHLAETPGKALARREALLRCRELGLSVREIAKGTGVSKAAIQNILERKDLQDEADNA